MTDYSQKIARQLDLKATQISATIRLLDEGNTLPFIARYRKEVTGSLDESQLRQVSQAVDRLRKVDDRRETILNTIQEQGKLTPDLEKQVQAAESLTELEDLYQPYKQKRRTRAGVAREKGLEPLATLILEQDRGQRSLGDYAAHFLNDDVPTADEAFAGARDIVAETISDDPAIRGQVREKAMQYGRFASTKIKSAEDPRGVYETYYEFDAQVRFMRPHQTLAINRGESEKILRVKVELEERDWLRPIDHAYRKDGRSVLAEQLEMAVQDAAKRLLLPAIERDVRRSLTEAAEQHAIEVFASNLRGLLNQPPLAGHTVIGLDPGYRTGCKVAVVNDTGKVIDTATIYPHPPQKRYREALDKLQQLVDRHQATLISIGNGTASRETEQLAADLTRNREDVHYLIVNEAGASVYSASKLAGEELPDLDVTLRGAASIARRVQDPLAELVKIDPKSVGVGLYQHDVDQKALGEAATAVVESVVNQVGVELNTASAALLGYVSGIGGKLASSIVEHRDQHGQFPNRKALKDVSGLGPKAFEQAAGFLRVRDSENLLDTTAIHPESYRVAEAVIERARLSLDTILDDRKKALDALSVKQLADELDAGVPTLTDIFEQLRRPGRDPREDLPAPILRNDVLSMDDLREGMQLSGTVRNVVDFGVFIDIGVKQDGLLHRSQIPRDQWPGVGDILDVKIGNVDKDRGRIGLEWVTLS